MSSFDMIVVGAGIVGLAHSLHASRDGRRVLVLDRDAQANGASIRNFGFVTVTGQGGPPGDERGRGDARLGREDAARIGEARA